VKVQTINIKTPPSLTDETKALFAQAQKAGFKHLGWLTVKIGGLFIVAGFANDDGSITLAMIALGKGNPFAPKAIDLVSHLDGPRTLTTTSHWLVAPRPAQGLFKYSHPDAASSDCSASTENT